MTTERWTSVLRPDSGRTELFGRILLSKEFGVTRQKLYVCSKSKVVRSKKAICPKHSARDLKIILGIPPVWSPYRKGLGFRVFGEQVLSFHPINGKLPGISVPWDEASSLPSNHDLHVVESGFVLRNFRSCFPESDM